MNIPSFAFIGFVLIVAVTTALSRRMARGPLLVLLCANLGFLALFGASPATYLPLFGFVAAGYLLLLTTVWWPGKFYLVCVAVFVALFAWIKKYDFVPSALLIPNVYFTIGISYIFFRILHLLVDSGQGGLPKRPGLLEYLAYTLDFTCLVAGPIQRLDEFRVSGTPLTIWSFGRAVERLTAGFFKVYIVSGAISAFQKSALLSIDSGHATFSDLLVAMGSYPFYLYFNFSGYVDAVIGAALLCQRTLPENFDRPFTSRSFIEFWSRWHITLSTFLKTYIYNPLMLSAMRRESLQAYGSFFAVFAFFVTFFLVGVWHGQTSEFLFFGVLQGGGVAFNKVYQLGMVRWFGRTRYRDLSRGFLYGEVARAATVTWFAFTLLWFWSSWGQIGHLIETLSPSGFVAVWAAFFLLILAVMPVLDLVRTILMRLPFAGAPLLTSRYARTAKVTALFTSILIVTFVLNSPAPDIVYKAF